MRYEDMIVVFCLVADATFCFDRQLRPRMECTHSVARRTDDRGPPCGETTDDHVKQRCEHEAEESHTQHPREHRDTHHATHLGARTTRDDQRYHTHDERERR